MRTYDYHCWQIFIFNYFSSIISFPLSKILVQLLSCKDKSKYGTNSWDLKQQMWQISYDGPLNKIMKEETELFELSS